MSPQINFDNLKKIVYVGTSMYPLLRDLDMLFLSPYDEQDLQQGDIIVFKTKKCGKDITITHRIFSFNKTGIITKGDNNPRIDDLPVNPSDILGLVVYAKRGNRLIRVHNGKTGIFLAETIHLLLRIKSITLRVISYPYNWVSRTGMLKTLVSPGTKQRVINFQRPGGIESHLLMGKYLVAKRRPGNPKWTILPPFKLFVDEASLPKNDLTSYDQLTNDDNISL
jgi:signal peptidase I